MSMKIGSASLLLLFACVLFAGFLPRHGAFALGVDHESDLAPYDVAKDFDLFTISGDFSGASVFPLILNRWNKGLQSADVPGFSFVISRDDTTPLSYDFLVKAGCIATSADWGDFRAWGPWTAGGYVSRDAGDPPVAWIETLMRTTRNASGFDDAIAIPLRTFVSGDAADTAGTLKLTDFFNGGTRACSVDCCGLRFMLDDCSLRDYATVRQENLRVWFDIPDRAGVYCCQDLHFAYSTESGKQAFMGFPFTVARLNDAADMIRVRVTPNSHLLWILWLFDSMVDPEDPCDTPDFTDLVTRPWKKDFNSCTQYTGTSSDQSGLILDRYLWRTDLFKAITSLDLIPSWDLIEEADLHFGETLNLGVWYGGVYDFFGPESCDCAESPCDPLLYYAVPRIHIQNLGTRALDVAAQHVDLTGGGICGTDCGLCDTLPYLFVDAVDRPEIPDLGGRGIYGSVPLLFLGLPGGTVDVAYRYGDFWRWNGLDASDPGAGDIISLNCPNAIYPAFTKTIQPMANRDFVFSAGDGTSVRGRWNTSYFTFPLELSSPDCSPDCSLLFVHVPCDCEASSIVSGLKSAVPDMSGDIYVISDDLQDGWAEFVRNPDPSYFPGIAALRAEESDTLVWYDAFSVEGLISEDGRGILPVQLRFTIPAEKLAGYDFSGDWRNRFWQVFTLKSRTVSGDVVADIAADLGAAAKGAMDWQSFIAADVDEIRTTGRQSVNHLTVWLTVFVADGPSPTGKAFNYVTLSTGNKILFVFDGIADAKIENILYIAGVEPLPTPTPGPTAAPTSEPWTLTLDGCPSGAVVVGTSFDLTAIRRPVVGDVSWSVENYAASRTRRTNSAEIVTLSGTTGDTATVTALSPGRAAVTARAGGLLARCELTVVPTGSPTPTGGPTKMPTTFPASGGGGCSAGFSGAFVLLFLAPLLFPPKR